MLQYYGFLVGSVYSYTLHLSCLTKFILLVQEAVDFDVMLEPFSSSIASSPILLCLIFAISVKPRSAIHSSAESLLLIS